MNARKSNPHFDGRDFTQSEINEGKDFGEPNRIDLGLIYPPDDDGYYEKSTLGEE